MFHSQITSLSKQGGGEFRHQHYNRSPSDDSMGDAFSGRLTIMGNKQPTFAKNNSSKHSSIGDMGKDFMRAGTRGIKAGSHIVIQ
jgi:hypothetical protein